MRVSNLSSSAAKPSSILQQETEGFEDLFLEFLNDHFAGDTNSSDGKTDFNLSTRDILSEFANDSVFRQIIYYTDLYVVPLVSIFTELL